MTDAPAAHQEGALGESPREDERSEILGLTRAKLVETLGETIDRPFRADQIYEAIYRQGKTDFEEMTTLGKDLRESLGRKFRIGVPAEADRHPSADGTVKYLFRLADGATIEAVDIPDRGRRTLCISSQAGCALACAFCVTGYWGAGRNLTPAEIVGQVLAIRRRQEGGSGPEPLNLVFMGMGEPLQNLEALHASLRVLTELVSWRRITVSTVGIVPGIRKLASWEKRPNLAVSLHAPDDARRDLIMPVNRTYPLADLLAALEEYPLERRRRITIEYLLIRDFNDAPSDAEALARLLGDLPVKINLIPVNPDPVLGERMVPPPDDRVDAFAERLRRRSYVATVRRRRGDDVSAACGQLRAPGREPRGFRQGALSW